MKQITICEDCKYESYNENLTECSKCGGKLEVIASERREELEK